MAYLEKTIAYLLAKAIRLYQLSISGFLGNCCRFHPTCSNYAQEAIKTHGLVYGVFLSLKRVGRCHPWHLGGFDPVPTKKLN